MTTFDRMLAQWIEHDGPSDVPASTVEGALATSRRIGQRRRPLLRDMEPRRRSMTLMLALVALSLAIAGAMLAGALVLRSPEPPVRISPDGRLSGISRAIPLGDGKVLVLGMGPSGKDLTGVLDTVTGETVWLSEPSTSAWGGIAVPLEDGSVLLAGGMRDGQSQSIAAAILDPRTMTLDPIDPLTEPRGVAVVLKTYPPLTVTLPGGRILIVGGTTDQVAGSMEPSGGDLFDPATRTFRSTPRIPCPKDHDTPLPPAPTVRGTSFGHEYRQADRPRGKSAGHELRWAAVMADGRVLLACDEWPAWPGRQSLIAFDVADGTFEDLGIVLEGAHRMLPLFDGSLLLWMWNRREQVPASGELARHDHYTLARLDPATGALTPLPAEPLAGSQAAMLADGRVLFVGGFEPGSALPVGTVQVLDPCMGLLTTVATLAEPRADAAVMEVRPGQLLVVGGDGGDRVLAHPVGPEVGALPAQQTCAPAG